MNTARLRLDNAATNANAAADTIGGNVGKTIIEGVDGSLEKHRIEVSNRLKSHFYEMSSLLSRNEGVWISGK